MSASKIAVVGLAFVSAVSGFGLNAGLPGMALRPTSSCGLTALSMSGIGNTKSFIPNDSRRGGKLLQEPLTQVMFDSALYMDQGKIALN
jgi:hypothetical protein